ncbi:hypothetical protein PRIC1_014097 [Phytophthora ramorum]
MMTDFFTYTGIVGRDIALYRLDGVSEQLGKAPLVLPSDRGHHVVVVLPDKIFVQGLQVVEQDTEERRLQLLLRNLHDFALLGLRLAVFLPGLVLVLGRRGSESVLALLLRLRLGVDLLHCCFELAIGAPVAVRVDRRST